MQVSHTQRRAAAHRARLHAHEPIAVIRAVAPVPRVHSATACSHVQWQRVAATSQWRELRPVAVVRCSAAPDASTPQTSPEEQDFDLLSNRIADLVAELKEELRGCSIFVVGMMGSGKSTVGKMLANTLKYAFFDTDIMIEMAHDKKPVAEIFKEYGQDYFRNCESEVLKQLAPYKNLVVATGGGAVIKPMNWSYMQQGVVVWLNGSTDLLARRVAKDGLEKRPLLHDGDNTAPPSEEQLYATAHVKLDVLLEERRAFYETADVTVSLEGSGQDAQNGAPTAVVMYRLLQALQKKIQDTKEEREARRNFTIENAGNVPTMRVQPAPGTQDGEAQQ